MTPVSPVAPGLDLPETVYAKNQPEYLPLPTYRYEDGTVVSRWKLTWRERFQVLFSGSIWLTMLTFNRPLQPVMIESACPILNTIPCVQEDVVA